MIIPLEKKTYPTLLSNKSPRHSVILSLFSSDTVIDFDRIF